LSKKDEINALNHQKEYYARLIENELLIREELQLSEAKLNGLLDKKLKEIEKANKESSELRAKIKVEEGNKDKVIESREALKAYLSELANANLLLVEAMKRSCLEDQKVHKILNKKLEVLDVAIAKTAGMEATVNYKRVAVLREKTNEVPIEKRAEKTGSTWINELTNIENKV
jgi:hypothetical protein